MEDKVTSLPTAELIALGEDLRAQQLILQADYALAIARADGPGLEQRLRAGFLDLAAKIRAELSRSLDDKTIMAAESKLATGKQNATARDLRVWARSAIERVFAALRAGARVPEEMTHPLDARTVPRLLGQANKLLSLLVEHAAALDAVGAPTQPLIDEGRAIADGLAAADQLQEQARGAKLPAAVAAFYAKKGELYTAIKMINHAGHELHARDPGASSRYNLSILYRSRRSPATTVSDPAPAAAPPS